MATIAANAIGWKFKCCKYFLNFNEYISIKCIYVFIILQMAFFRQHNCLSKDAQQKYNSRAAQLYRDKLLQTAKQAMKTFGTQVCN